MIMTKKKEYFVGGAILLVAITVSGFPYNSEIEPGGDIQVVMSEEENNDEASELLNFH
ncbi:hypothetical protein [Salipaludibacillus keqinensis]|uniref:hypothetical protein n=1 Tax=Salipaludibacillus keqinensis TaxID=2045207 RepID=UPI001304B721|nr:hypothetical protein [Salipaludibacillus keqinensis]